MKYIDINSTLFNTLNKYPEVKDFLISQGLNQVEDESLIKTIGKTLTLDAIIKTKGFNRDLFVKQMEDIIKESRENVDSTLTDRKKNEHASINIQGILPCPVRLPLLEGFEDWMDTKEKTFKDSVDYELKAASMGVEWLKESLENGEEEKLADVFLSAGFDLFFDDRLMGHLKKQKKFEDIVSYKSYNKDFENDDISLKDPDKDYSIIGVVPAVFLVNKDVLGDRKFPNTWEDLLNGEFDNGVSLPVGDFDLFNAILLNIHKKYGFEGVAKLGKTLMRSMHPSEMVKSNTKAEQPLVTIMPYFFTKMVHEKSPMVAVWPEDGAIISPIFLLSKRENKEELQPIVDFFASKEVGEILSHNGRFPSTHPEVDNRVDPNNKYMWVGWDYIKGNDIGRLIEECLDVFNGGKL